MALTPRGIQKPDGSTPMSIMSITAALADTTDAAIDAVDPKPGAIDSAGFTPAAGWTVLNFRTVKAGPILSIVLEVERTGGTISVPASGDIANSVLGVIDAGKRPLDRSGLHSAVIGRAATGAVLANGNIMLCAVGGTSNIENGNVISLTGVVITG